LSAFNEKHIFGEAGKAWEWRVKELQDLFSMALKEVAQWSEVTIFVDALDETGSESAAKLVNYFHQLNDTVAADRHSSVKICISCRHYPVVARSPGLEILVEKENYRDIWTFVHGELEKSQSRPEDPLFIEKRKELGYEIVKKAENSFQWTGMILPKVLAFLNDGESFEDISNMIAGESSDLSRRNRTRTLFLMQWVCLAERPLSLTELRYALACDDEVVQPHQVRCDDSKMFVESDGRMKTLVNSLSGGLVETRHHESECIVQVCHQTVNDFLKSSGLRFLLSRTGNENLTVDEVIGRSQDRLSRCCINYLKLGEVLNENRIWNEEPVNDLFFIEYATKYWAVHAEKAENHGISHEGLVEEISALFGTWANIYRAIDKRASRCPEPGSTLIHIAAESNLRSTVEALLQNGTSVEEETDLNNRPLHYAARWGHESLAALLLDANADREAKNLYGGTPLERAAANNHERVVKMLLDRGVNVNEKTGWYGTALESASRKGSGRLVRMLIDNGADINARGEDGSNPLQAAALNGDKAILQLLLDEGAHVNAVGGFWGTALQAAALGIGESSEACVRILLESGAQVNLRGGHNDNALQAAAACSKDNAENLVRILLDNGADVNFYGGEYGSALQAGASCGSEQVVHMLLNAGADVHLKGGRCGNALQAAASRGHERLVQLLLDKGSDIHAEGGLYGSALNGAASGAHRAVMNLLLDQGADINAECGDCGSVLQAATYRCNESVIQWLIKRGAKVNAQCGEFGTALQAAAHWNRNEKILQLLLDNGADVNAKSSGMCATPLQSASYVGNVAAVKFLLDNGADINTQGGWYGSALQAAVAFHEQEVVKLLLERGADITAKEGFYGNVFEAARDDKSMIQILLEYSAET
jgi:ankyrin repeat protein